jgi:glycosyltransferase involved in cell wall biosynthesis
MRYTDAASAEEDNAVVLCEPSRPLIIASMLREEGITGVHTHVRQFRQYLGRLKVDAPVVTSFSWNRTLTVPVFGLRLAVRRCSGAAGVVWYRHWHEVFLHYALRRRLAELGECVVYAQGPLAARAALRARRGKQQRVILAVHFRISQSDEWADKKEIKRGGTVFRKIRQAEREIIPHVDGIVYVSRWARDALLGWFPEAAALPATVIFNFVEPLHSVPRVPDPLGDLVTVGNLDFVKNHRYLLQVLAETKKAGRVFTLDVFGEGPLRSDLVRQISSLGLEDQVRLRGFRRDVRTLLPGYRAYVHASYSEACCLAIIEAMAAGLPIVAGNIESISELFDDGVEGRYWPLDDPVQAAAALIDLLDCEPERLKAARSATERFRRDYDADHVAPRLYRYLMGTTPPARRSQPAGATRPS